jgi:hypothetical protein
MAEETTQDSYSPLLAQMLKIDPNKVGQVSLAALGRQALGAESPEYRAAKAEVDAARAAMVEALANRQNRVDPSMLALAQGFLAPTRTGSFGESLGTAVGGYRQAQESEENRLARLAQMRYELAKASLGEEQQAAQLGLNVASKLTPKMTAYQLQVQSEGIDPRSSQGVARIKELLAGDKATPEMKAFAAQEGISLTDPTFSGKFQLYSETKNLQDIASKFGYDLRTPEGRAAAQRQAQVDIDLERKGKQTTIEAQRQNIAASKQQMERTAQEINDHIRQGDLAAVQTTALEAGVPIDPKSQFTGLNKKEIVEKRQKEMAEASKFINEKVTPLVNSADDDLNDLRRALQLNTEIKTGYSYGIPGVGELVKLGSGDRAKINEFDSIAARAAKMNRIPGDSNVSNADMAWMRLGTFSSDKEPSTNKNILEFMIAQRQRDKDYNEYLQKYAAVNGNVGPHAQAQWRKYLEANPITTRDPRTGAISLNPARMSFQQYFSTPRVRVDAQGREEQ